MSKNITNNYITLKEFIEKKTINLCHFDEVAEFKYYRTYDYEEWVYRYNIELTMVDGMTDKTIMIMMRNISGNFTMI